MKIGKYVVAVMIAVSVVIGATAHSTQAKDGPTPTAGTLVTGGLLTPFGMKLGNDGMIYVAEAGTGGTTPFGEGENATTIGFTGRISRIDPSNGSRQTVADGLPSSGNPEAGVGGVADVALLGDQVYFLMTSGGADHGFPNNPNGIYRVNTNGTTTLFANTGDFVKNNPVADVKSGKQQDVDQNGNPYALIVRNGDFYVVDGNQNRILKVNGSDGTISSVTEFPGHPVTTGIGFAAGGSGPFYVGGLGEGPFIPTEGRVFKVDFPGGAVTEVASGFSSITDVDVAPDGQLYAVSFGDPSGDEQGLPWVPGSAKILRVDLKSATMTPLVSGFSFSTSMLTVHDSAYFLNDSVGFFGAGELWRVDGLSTLKALPATAPVAAAPAPVAPAAPAPRPVAAPISAPDTGSGPTAVVSDRLLVAVAVLALGGFALLSVGSRRARNGR